MHPEKIIGFEERKIAVNYPINYELSQKLTQGVFPPIFAGYAEKGIFCFKFHINGNNVYFIIGYN